MPLPLDKSISSVFAACQDFYLVNKDVQRPLASGLMYKRLKQALTSVLYAMAKLHEVMYPGYGADRDHHGYLIRLDAPFVFRIPYHVLPTFPSGGDLDLIWALARRIRSSEGSVIALSGSNVLRKVFDIVGDIDFCEYFPESDKDGFRNIISNLSGDEELMCLRLALFGIEWCYPWDKASPTCEFLENYVDCASEKRSSIKMEYVGDIGTIGVSEISNLIIVTDERGVSASIRKTFAAQEVPLVPINWLPNQMSDPMEMGRYVNWLSSTIRDLLAKGDMRKCLKRCASLSRILCTYEITNKIFDISFGSTVLIKQKILQLEVLEAKLLAISDDRSKRFCCQIVAQIQALTSELSALGGEPDGESLKRFDNDVTGVAKHLLSQLLPGYDPHSKRAA